MLLTLSLHSQAQDEGKMQLQQQMLLSKEKQAELNRQQQQKILLEAQKQKLDSQEKALLKLQYDHKQAELLSEKKEALASIQKTRLSAKYQAAIKDKEIGSQKEELEYSRIWNASLISISFIIVLAAIVVYRSQRKTKRLNKLIIKQHEELEQVSSVKDRLLSVVGHDMLNPLNMLTSLSYVLQHEKVPSDKMVIYMSQLETTLSHTTSLIDNLLQWAASQMEGYKPIIESVELDEVVNEVITFLDPRARDKRIKLLNKVNDQVTASCDRNMMAVVLRNLVNNSIKFTPAGGTVEITSEEKGKFISICVIDRGIGMSDENIRRFNETSITAVESTRGTEREKGTGLGLLLCKTFVQLMKGRISTRKNPHGKGSIFEITVLNG